jgi:phosphoribosylformimino-5-aminoimidazole carboxamide ribonucleotide (ProFAR) isomerase
MTFEVIPAIDLRGGQVVRLKQGDYAQQTTYASDPRGVAARYAQAGATWLHLVDLDGARSGKLDNLAVVAAIAGDGMQVQAGGGVREEADLQRLFDAGVQRVVLGSVAIRDPERVAGWLETPTSTATACWPVSTSICIATLPTVCRHWQCRRPVACVRWTISARHAKRVLRA